MHKIIKSRSSIHLSFAEEIELGRDPIGIVKIFCLKDLYNYYYYLSYNDNNNFIIILKIIIVQLLFIFIISH